MQLLPNIVDGMAKLKPEALYAQSPASYSSYDKGYRKITYHELANAVNGIAWLLTEELGRGENFETLAYFGPNDLSYPVVILGAVKAGYKQALSPRTVHVPTIFQLLDGQYKHYPYVKTFEAARDEPLMVVHTSGTTSDPKPIVLTHEFAASYTSWIQAEAPDGFKNAVSLVQSNRLFVTLPFFHAGCLYATLIDAITSQTTIITPLTGVSPSAPVIIEGLKRVESDALLLTPPFMEQIAKNPEMLDLVCSKVRYVAYGGGDVSKTYGDAFASRLILFNFNGSTETGPYPMLRSADDTSTEDWKYIHPHPASGLEFRPSVDGLFEAFIVRKPDPEQEQPVFKIFPELKEYRTKDLWLPHPARSGSWLYRGRLDDIIVFKTGYLCNPIQLEQELGNHPDVRSALMAGTGRYHSTLLIEPMNDEWLVSGEARDSLIDRVWPAIQEANKAYPESARVQRSHILVIDADKRLRRASKGTVQRGPSIKLYEAELEKLYEEPSEELGSLYETLEVS
ncbi:MAG: hypothetical protein Q9225_006706 [Loekoesia sp. 1 TL-2023]